MTMHNAHSVIHGFVGVGVHDGLVPPAPAVAPIPHISASLLPGLTIKAKYSPTVLGQFNAPLVARGNDSGFVVSHVSIPPNNTLIPITIALGGSKVLFGSSKTLIQVDGQGQQCGCCLPPFVPLSQNLACDDPCSMPTDYVIAPNTVEVGMTLGDLLAGLVSGILDTALSWALGQGAGAMAQRLAGMLARQIAQRSFREFAEVLGEESARIAVREATENITEWFTVRAFEAAAKEGIKTAYDSLLDADISAVAGIWGRGEGADRDALYDGLGRAAVGDDSTGMFADRNAAVTDQRVYGADGTERLTGSGI